MYVTLTDYSVILLLLPVYIYIYTGCQKAKYKNAKEHVEGIEINGKVLYHFAKFARIAEILIILIERIDARREKR